MIDVRKPYRLWGLTGRKHFQRMLQDKYEAVPPQSQKDKLGVLQVVGLTVLSALGIAVSFGKLTEAQRQVSIVKPDGSCGKPAKAKPKSCTAPKEPCPPEPPPKMKPCGDPCEGK